MKLKKIVCALDFSEHSDETLAYAASLAAAQGAELLVVNVIEHLHGFDNFQILALAPDEIAAKLEVIATEKLAAHLATIRDTVPQATSAVRHGKASSQIIEAAEEADADLIVMGSHGRTGLSHLLLGSAAEAVVRGAGCAVLVVK